MARYGTRRYNSGFKYGELSTVGVYYEANLQAKTIDYQTIQVTWNNIVPDPSDPAPTHWKLVRSIVGSLDNPDQATFIVGGAYSAFSNTYTDILNVNTPQELHYSLWVFNGLNWILCGNDYEIVVSNTNTIDTIARWIPKAWLNPTDSYIGDGIGENENNTFYKILSMYALVYDQLRSQTFLLENVTDSRYTPSQLLKSDVEDLGFLYEPSLGDAYHRSLYGSGSFINSYKGTAIGIGTYTTALTHWANDIVIGHNLLLDYNDASFEESLGRWTASSGTFAQKTYAANPSVVVPAKTQVLFDPIFKPRLAGFAQLTTTATTAVTLSLPNNSITLNAVPIKGNTRYLFSGQVLHLDNSATISTVISWYDMFGTLISSTAAPTAITTSTTWKEFTTSSDSGRNGRVSPVNARFAKVVITVTPGSASSSRYAFDLFQFAEAYKSFEYQDAKLIKVEVVGDQENYLSNGDFEAGLFMWSGFNGTLVIDNSVTSGVTTNGVHGTKALKFTSSSATSALVSDWVAIDPGKVLTFSSYILSTVTGHTAIVRVEFSHPIDETDQVKVLSDTEGQYYSTNTYYVESSAVTLSTTEKKQLSVTAISPAYTRDAGYPLVKVSIIFPDANNTVYYVDGAMIEHVDTANRFYSGIGGIVATNPVTQQYYSPDYTRWETKNIFNYMSNPSFETNTTDWTSTGTLTRVATDASMGPLYGTYFGKVAYTTSTSITGTAYLPYAASGGEDFIVSAYVRGAVATYTINGTSYTAVSGDEAIWQRISGVYKLTAGATSLAWTINVANTTGSTSTYFHIDGTQAEYGRIPNRFVDPSDGSNTTILTNPVNSAKSLYAIQGESTYAGKSNFLYNYGVKLSRLKNTLVNYVPNGSTFSIKTGHENYGYRDMPESLIINNSFETSLGSWTAVNSTLSRSIARGMEFSESLSHGQAYCSVTTAGSSGNIPFGLKTDKTYISDSGGYYASVAIQPNSNTAGSYALKVEFFNSQDVSIYSKTKTKTFTTTTRWAYLADTYSVANIAGAAYAILSVTATPTGGYVSGQTFKIDRVVFRQ